MSRLAMLALFFAIIAIVFVLLSAKPYITDKKTCECIGLPLPFNMCIGVITNCSEPQIPN